MNEGLSLRNLLFSRKNKIQTKIYDFGIGSIKKNTFTKRV